MLLGRTFGSYLGLRFLRTIGGVFLTVFVLVYTLDFVEQMRQAGDAENVGAAEVAFLSLLRTPAVAEQVLPFAVLFGGMITLLGLSRKLELVVARAAGVSAWQFLQPGIVVAAGIGILAVFVYNPLAAMLQQEASARSAVLFARDADFASARNVWIRQRSPDGTAIIRAEGVVEGTTRLARPMILVFDREGRFVERIEAREGVLREGAWELTDARVTALDVEPRLVPRYELASSLDPGQLRTSFTPPESVPFWRLDEIAEQTELAGLDATSYRLQREALMARPLLFVAMILVAASVSLRFFRFGGVGQMVLGGVAAGFLLYVATELMEDLGGSGLVGTTLAAWFPAVVGSLLGVLVLLHKEDG
ncbi:LPS export ABC transporter permease LptG [Salinarimonas ramus]|uniref:LPS export ABC transporter permease LptG n=1 Tax=Salinarimonas ramus TaxID=690164 RepID=A0A917Q6R1_9HYPH|nr:LPS export ABC transporter permease LptG [Salinarimonas ramus]GGK31676.1 LPS export ABC transporter permease LptG [Salinarimonas ramus]